MIASGNDFVIIETNQQLPIASLRSLAQRICNRKYGVGADGLLLLEKSKIADIKMRIFNPDGSEAKMCGNGARCVALWANSKLETRNSKLKKIETKAGIIESQVNRNNVKIKLSEPKDIKLDIPVKINNRLLRVNFINTGVAHTVIFVEGIPRTFTKARGLDKIDALSLGRQIRYHKRFAPAGTNVDFVEILSNNSIKIRTYERGVEDETLACGTGAVASSLIAYRLSLIDNIPTNVLTRSGEILKVYFKKEDNSFNNIWLEGRARIVYKGEYYV